MKTLERGRCYFMLSYFDEQMRMPLVETYVYLGENLGEADQEGTEITWYLMNPDAYLATGGKVAEASAQDCIRVGEDTIELVLDLQELIERLAKLSV